MGHRRMNTYRAVETVEGQWVVIWWCHGIWQAPVWGTFPTEAEAAFHAYSLTLMEWREAQRHPAKTLA